MPNLRDLMRERMPQASGRWYDIRNADSDDKAVVRIYDFIDMFGVDADQFARELDHITAPEIEVQINSLGGSVFDGVTIYNALRTHDARVTTRVDGIAASIASVVVQAGDHRVMLSGSQQMIHRAWGISIGNADDHREMGGILDQQDSVIASIYAGRSGRPAAELEDLMGDETWMDAEEAVEAGLADEVVDPPRKGDPSPEDTGRRLTDQIDTVVGEVEDVTDRIVELVTLRGEQGRATDDTWQTRGHVDRVAEALDTLRGALTPAEDDTGEDTSAEDAERELLRSIAADL